MTEAQSVREKILRKVRGLAAMAVSAKEVSTEEEAYLFAERMREMMLRHKISQLELDANDPQLKAEAMHKVRITSDHGVTMTKRRCAWSERLGAVVAKAHFTRVVCHIRSSSLTFAGHESDVAASVEAYAYLWQVLESLSWKAYNKLFYGERAKGHMGDVGLARGYRAAYLRGFVSRLSARYVKQMEQLESDKVVTVGALVLMKNVTVAVNQYVVSWTRPAARVRGQRADNSRGYRDGQLAADKLSLKPKAKAIC